MSETCAVVVGAGPAGLSAARALEDAGLSYVLFDSGKAVSERMHEHAADLAQGVGGAGLFSDGKFSFFPSATELYRLAHRHTLRCAHDWCTRELDRVGISTESFPSEERLDKDLRFTSGTKHYPSHYASLEQRRTLVGRLAPRCDGALRVQTRVTALRGSAEQGYRLEYQTGDSSHRREHRARAVILASGRFGGFALGDGQLTADLPLHTLRYEFGIRVESPASIGFLPRTSAADVKRMWSGSHPVRTFCTCRDGEVWQVSHAGLSAISGRSDGPATGYSNFGLLVRFSGDRLDEGRKHWRAVEAELRRPLVTYEPVARFLALDEGGEVPDLRDRPWHPRERFRGGSIRARVGDEIHGVLAHAVRQLLTWAPDLLDPRTMCLFPSIEGVGRFPEVDEELRVPGTRVWCAGDVVGAFRGIVASMVSGYYAGARLAHALNGVREEPAYASHARAAGKLTPA